MAAHFAVGTGIYHQWVVYHLEFLVPVFIVTNNARWENALPHSEVAHKAEAGVEYANFANNFDGLVGEIV